MEPKPPIVVRAAQKMCMRPEDLIKAVVMGKKFSNAAEVAEQNIQRWRNGQQIADYITRECRKMVQF